MKRITLIVGVVALMAAMLVALAVPALAQDTDRDGNRGDGVNRADQRFDEDWTFVEPPVPPVEIQPVPPVPPVETQPVDLDIVEPGETLWGIAQEQLGPAAPPEQIAYEVKTIHDLNRDRLGDNPHMIYPGQELRLPSHR